MHQPAQANRHTGTCIATFRNSRVDSGPPCHGGRARVHTTVSAHVSRIYGRHDSVHTHIIIKLMCAYTTCPCSYARPNCTFANTHISMRSTRTHTVAALPRTVATAASHTAGCSPGSSERPRDAVTRTHVRTSHHWLRQQV